MLYDSSSDEYGDDIEESDGVSDSDDDYDGVCSPKSDESWKIINQQVFQDLGKRPYQEDRYSIIDPEKMNDNNVTSSSNKEENKEDKKITTTTTNSWYIFGVFDGHGGKEAVEFVTDYLTGLPITLHKELTAFSNKNKFKKSKHLIKKLITQCFISMDERLYEKIGIKNTSGTTAAMVIVNLILKKMWVINLGDSSVIVSGVVTAPMGSASSIGGAAGASHVIYQTKKHSPLDIMEQHRINLAGSSVFRGQGKLIRVNGRLAMSRALGDFIDSLKTNKKTGKIDHVNGPVSVVPDILEVSLGNSLNSLDNKVDNYDIIITTDGITDVLSSTKLVALQKSNKCNSIIKKAIKKGATDNMTIICFSIQKILI